MATVREIRARFVGDAAALKGVFREITAAAGTLGPAVRRSTSEANRHYTSLSSNAGKLRQALERAGQVDAFEELNSSAEQAQREMDATGRVSQETMAQLERAVSGAGAEFGQLGDEARSGFGDIEQAVNALEGDLRNLSNAGDLGDLSDEARRASGEIDDLADSSRRASDELDDLGDGGNLDDIGESAESASGGLAGLISGSGGGLVAKVAGGLGLITAAAGGVMAGFKMLSTSGELKGAMNSLQVQTGATADEIDGMRDSLLNIYGNNFGEGFEDIADSMASVKGATQLTGTELEKATERSILLRDSFGWEVPEQMNAVRVMMQEFGYTAEEAFTVLAQGQQSGVNGAEDLLDTFNEYSGAFADLGFDGEQAMNMITNSVREGARNTDVAADAVNEFATRIADGSDLTAESLEAAGLNAEEMIGKFRQGGPTAAAAFQEVTAAIGSISDPLKREQTAVGLFGTMAEDAGVQTVLALGNVEGQADATADTLDQMNAIKYDTLGAAISGVGRMATVHILIPIQDKIMPGVNAAITGVTKTLGTLAEAFGALMKGESATSILQSYGLDPDEFQPLVRGIEAVQQALKDLGDRSGPVLKNIGDTIKTALVEIWPTVANALGTAMSFVADFVTRLSGLWNENGAQVLGRIKEILIDIWPSVRTALSTIVGFIGEQVGKIVAFWQENGAQIKEAVTNVFNGIMAVIDFVMPAVLGIIKMVWGNIKGVISGALDFIMGLVKTFSSLFTGDFKGMWEGIKQMFSGAVEFIWNFIQLTFYGKILTGAKTFILAFRTGFASLWSAVKALFTGNGTAILNFLKAAWDEMWGATRKVFTDIGNFLKNTWNSIRSMFTGAITAIRTVFTTGWNAISTSTRTIFTAVWNFLKSIFTTIKNFLTTSLTNYRTAFSNAWNTISTNTRNVFTAIWNFFKSIFTTIRNFIDTTVSWLLTKITNTWNSVSTSTRNIFNSIWNFIKGIFTNTRNTISSAVDDILRKVTDTWNSLKTTTSNVFRDIFNAVKTRFTDIVNAAKELPGRIGTGIGNMASKVTEGVTKVINTLATTLGKGVNGVIGGINWVLDKIGVSSEVPEWKVPQYAQGTGGHPGGLAVVGDGTGDNAGPELIQHPDGTQELSPSKPTLVNLAKGTRIASAKMTRQLMERIPHYALGNVFSWGLDRVRDTVGVVRSAASTIKDKAFDVFSYFGNPGKLLDLAMQGLGLSIPNDPGFISRMATGAVQKVKKGAVDFIKDKMGSLFAGSGDGFPGMRKTSSYGMRFHPVHKEWRMHNGDDWGAPQGTPIPAQAAGKVTAAGYHSIRGNYVRVQSGPFERIYQHNVRNAVSTGQTVKKGQIVGWVGETGTATGPHLHYEVLRNGSHINPAGYKDGGIVNAKQLAWLAEGGWAESIISHDPAKRSSQREIWNQTGDMLGFNQDVSLNREIIEILERIAAGVESDADRNIIMNDRVVGQLLERHVTEQQQLENKRQSIFGGRS